MPARTTMLLPAILLGIVTHASAAAQPPGWPDQITLNVCGAAAAIMDGDYELYFEPLIGHYVNGDRANPWMRLLLEDREKSVNRATGWLFYDEGWPGTYYEYLFAGEMTPTGFAVTWTNGDVTITGPGNIPEPSLPGAVMLSLMLLSRQRFTRRAVCSALCRCAPSPCSC